MSIAYVLFDLDDTLYPPGAGLMQALSARITRYISERLGLPPSVAEELRRDYYAHYGSATRGLIRNHAIDVARYLEFVHDLPVESYLAPDPDLGCLLDCIEADKVLFTNAPAAYAQRVLAVLGISDRFKRVFDIEFGNYFGKPNLRVYWRVEQALRVSGAKLAIVDDAVANLAPARRLNWRTIWVCGKQSALSDSRVDYVVNDLWQVADTFQQLGVMDATHRAIAAHRLAGCAWAEQSDATK